MLTLTNPAPPEEVAIEPPGDKGEDKLPKNKGEDVPPSKGEEGEHTWKNTQTGAEHPSEKTNVRKRPADMDIDPQELQRTRGIKKDY